MNIGQSVIAGSAPEGVRRRARSRGYQGVITKIDGDHITVRFGERVTRRYHKSNLSFLKPNKELSRSPRAVASRAEPPCSPSFRAEVERIANDYIPDNDGQAPQALVEMREALQSLLANAPAEARYKASPPSGCSEAPCTH